jgi:hypothetical protein
VTPKAEKPRNPKRRRSAYRAIRYVRATPGRCGAVALEAAPPSLGRHLLQVSQAGCQPFTRRWRPEPAPCTTELPVDCLGQVAVMPAKARTERLRHSAPLARVSGNVAAAERRSTHAARASNSSTGEAVFRAALSGTAWTRRLRRHASRRATVHAVNPGLDASHSEARCQRGRVFPSATRHHASGHVPSVRLPLRRPDADSHLPGDHQGRRTRILGDAVYDPDLVSSCAAADPRRGPETVVAARHAGSTGRAEPAAESPGRHSDQGRGGDHVPDEGSRALRERQTWDSTTRAVSPLGRLRMTCALSPDRSLLRHSRAPAHQKSCKSGPSGEALYRTRTDDPFLTMEVLYQLS